MIHVLQANFILCVIVCLSVQNENFPPPELSASIAQVYFLIQRSSQTELSSSDSTLNEAIDIRIEREGYWHKYCPVLTRGIHPVNQSLLSLIWTLIDLIINSP